MSALEYGDAFVGWKTYQTETNPILIDVYADTDASGFDSVPIASGLSNDQNETVSISALVVGKSYYLYLIAKEAPTTERAYAYAAAPIVISEVPVPVTGAQTVPPVAEKSGGPCVIAKLPGDPTLARKVRDKWLTNSVGRVATWIYYSIFG